MGEAECLRYTNNWQRSITTGGSNRSSVINPTPTGSLSGRGRYPQPPPTATRLAVLQRQAYTPSYSHSARNTPNPYVPGPPTTSAAFGGVAYGTHGSPTGEYALAPLSPRSTGRFLTPKIHH